MGSFKLFCARYVNPRYARVLYVLLVIVALVLTGGAPTANGGSNGP